MMGMAEGRQRNYMYLLPGGKLIFTGESLQVQTIFKLNTKKNTNNKPNQKKKKSSKIRNLTLF